MPCGGGAFRLGPGDPKPPSWPVAWPGWAGRTWPRSCCGGSLKPTDRSRSNQQNQEVEICQILKARQLWRLILSTRWQNLAEGRERARQPTKTGPFFGKCGHTGVKRGDNQGESLYSATGDQQSTSCSVSNKRFCVSDSSRVSWGRWTLSEVTPVTFEPARKRLAPHC